MRRAKIFIFLFLLCILLGGLFFSGQLSIVEKIETEFPDYLDHDTIYFFARQFVNGTWETFWIIYGNFNVCYINATGRLVPIDNAGVFCHMKWERWWGYNRVNMSWYYTVYAIKHTSWWVVGTFNNITDYTSDQMKYLLPAENGRVLYFRFFKNVFEIWKYAHLVWAYNYSKGMGGKRKILYARFSSADTLIKPQPLEAIATTTTSEIITVTSIKETLTTIIDSASSSIISINSTITTTIGTNIDVVVTKKTKLNYIPIAILVLAIFVGIILLRRR
ncbi:MAG: hypothetical protein Q6363_007810 [Candidatus Njordarchaeota archaeon]